MRYLPHKWTALPSLQQRVLSTKVRLTEILLSFGTPRRKQVRPLKSRLRLVPTFNFKPPVSLVVETKGVTVLLWPIGQRAVQGLAHNLTWLAFAPVVSLTPLRLALMNTEAWTLREAKALINLSNRLKRVPML